MSSEKISSSSSVISDSTALSKQSLKLNERNDSTGLTSNQIVINTQELNNNKIDDQKKTESVTSGSSTSSDSSWCNFVMTHGMKPAPPPEEDEDDVFRRKIANGEISGYIIHHSPTRKYEPMRAIDRLLNSHLRTRVTEKTAQTPINTTAQMDIRTEQKDNSKTNVDMVVPQKVTLDIDMEVDHVSAGVPEWMMKPKDKIHKKDKVKPGLECVEKLRKFYIYDNIRIFDTITEDNNWTKNWMTLRNADFQQLFYIGTKNNHNTSSYRSFTLNVVDQYSRRVISVKKHWKSFCCGLLSADIECPPDTVIGHLNQTRFFFDRTVEFIITDPKKKKKRFIIRRMADTTIRHEFDILNSSLESIGSIVKRFEKIELNRVLKEDHHIRIGVPMQIPTDDKALLISAGVLINIFYLRKFKAIENK